MKQNIVVLLGSYHPNYSAVGICAKNVIGELRKEANVFVVSTKTSFDDLEYIKFENYHVYRTSTFIHNLKLFKTKKTTSNTLKFINLVASIIGRFLGVCMSFFQKENVDFYLVRKYLSLLLELDKKHRIDKIICFSFPFETVLAAQEMYNKHRKIDYIPYLFDNFIDSQSLHRNNLNLKIKKLSHLKLLKDAISDSSFTLAVHTLKQSFGVYNVNIDPKILFIEHPLLVPIKCDHANTNNNQELVFFYAGSFITKYVEPKFMIEVLQKITNIPKSKFIFFVIGNCLKDLYTFTDRNKCNTELNYSVPYEIVIEKLCLSSILLCVSEYKGIQMSSKIFTYMSVGKPIILFFYSDDDINNKILLKYPLYFGIQKSKYSDSLLKELHSFINNNMNSKLIFEEVEKLYFDAKPEISANLIIYGK